MESLWPIFAALAFCSLCTALVANLCSWRVLSRRIPTQGSTPPISILKPLKGVDDGLYLNLVSFAQLDYPEYEVILGAEDAGDPSLDVARRVQREFPAARITVMQCRGYRGKNPKVRSLQSLAAKAQYRHWLISDSNVRVDSSWLRDTAAEMSDTRVALVTNPIAPMPSDVESLGALFENLHLGSFVLGAIALPRVLADRACVIGKSMLLDSRALHAVGGLRSVRNLLAEDYLLGRKFELAGYRVALSPHPVQTVNESWTLERFCNRHIRWGQMRRRISLAAYLGEPLLNPIPLILVALGFRVAALLSQDSIDAAGSPWARAIATSLGAIAIKCALDMSLLRRLRKTPLSLFDSAWIPLKDILIAAIWPVAAVRRTLDWRGNPLRIGRASRLFAMDPEVSAQVGQEPA